MTAVLKTVDVIHIYLSAFDNMKFFLFENLSHKDCQRNICWWCHLTYELFDVIFVGYRQSQNSLNGDVTNEKNDAKTLHTAVHYYKKFF